MSVLPHRPARVGAGAASPPRRDAELSAVRTPAAVLLLATAVVAVAGALAVGVLPAGTPAQRLLHPDLELQLPAVYSALLLASAGVLTLLAAHGSAAYVVMGVGLVAFGLDELFWLHERLEAGLGVDWQVLYLPVAVAALGVLVVVVRGLRSAPRARTALLAGAACWAASQVLEALQWDGDVQRPGYGYMMIVEESLEMFGTVGVILAMLLLLRREGPSQEGGALEPPAARSPRHLAA